jgi:hypothetical protein
MSIIRYAYDVKVSIGASMLEIGGIPRNFPNVGEMLIKSKEFEELGECERTLSSLLSALSSYEMKCNSIPHVIVTKTNPLLTPNVENKDNEHWDTNIMLKAYIADANELKQLNLKFYTYAQIRSVEPDQSYLQ